jgi:transposase
MDSIHLPQSKKKARAEDATIVFEDEASFRQSTTLHQTWAPVNSQPKIPCHGKRNSLKVYGGVCPQNCQFDYRIQKHYFDSEDYIAYLEDSLARTFYRKGHRIFLIHDNASYHKGPEVLSWAEKYKKYIHVEPLPTYSPELNAAEKIWKYTRKEATHNQYFEEEKELYNALKSTFAGIKRDPKKLMGYMRPFL